MTIHVLTAAPAIELARALADFERQFTYPLGGGRRFGISHGLDYTRFFRSLGEGACFVAERDGRALGVISTAIRRLVTPGGAPRRALYVGDVKVDPEMRGGLTLLELGNHVQQWARPQVDCALGVAMEGTVATPDRYTGRFGVPFFAPLGRVAIVRIPTRAGTLDSTPWIASDERGRAVFARLSEHGFALPDCDAALRSRIEPRWLVDPGGRACARLEDTRRAKQLFEVVDSAPGLEAPAAACSPPVAGAELRSAHLACAAFESVDAAISLIDAALTLAAAEGEPALFVSFPEGGPDTLMSELRARGAHVTSATVYGAGLEPGGAWFVSTSEI